MEELESCDFKDIVYGGDQCAHIAGALVPEALIPRLILIPNGSFKHRGNRRVWIDRDAEYLPGPDGPLYHTNDRTGLLDREWQLDKHMIT